MTMATADMVLPRNVEADRAEYDGVSLRILTQYQAGTDIEITRLDVLYGYLFVRPEWCVAVPDAV